MILFLLQLVSDFVETTYGLCLTTTSLNKNVFSVLLLFLPLILLFFRRGLPDGLAIAVGELVILCRILEPMLVTQAKMIVSGIGVGCFLIFLPAFLLRERRESEEQSGMIFLLGMCVALVLSIFFRTLGTTRDLSTYGRFQFIGWILAVGAATMILGLPQARRDMEKNASTWKILALTLGIMSIFALIYFAFSSPTVISRWTQGNHIAITVVLMSVIAQFTVVMTLKPDILNRLRPPLILILNGLFVFALIFTIASHQMSFPSESSAYPIDASSTSVLAHISLFLMLVLSPVISLDLALLTGELIKSKPTPLQMGGSFILASVYLLIIVFANIFTITYDYIPVIGMFFRDKLWLVFLVAALIAALPVLFILFIRRSSVVTTFSPRARRTIVRLSWVLCIGVIVGTVVTDSNPLPHAGARTSATILTYNILVGRNVQGIMNFDGQLAKIKGADADIIGLQETGAARIPGGNTDVVRYFADKLDLYSYYGPKTVTGTFGIALLSKHPIENPRTFYMYSKGQQTACIEAQINIDKRTFNVFVTHLTGSNDPSQIFQQKSILSRLKGKKNVILMGDFNFRSNTEQYRLTTDVLNDSWQVNFPERFDNGRIDHIFLSPEIEVIDSGYLRSDDSDHPALKTIISLPVEMQ